ncbi:MULTISPECIES: hypothetical protein [unclassified Pasteurella]|uniref:hypothetical protein n=1 Tax=unclassified Pasteurella TaxID=2621516 RepID=UPI001073CD9F|nr:hypothetical protein [Pasteurella sp. 19428wF3_WM03]TFU50454.1 hypothetical protein E4T92_08775 [Pasteurella sp. WM03]
MKKLLLILLSAFAITACGGEDKEAENQPGKTTVIRTKADFASSINDGVEYDVSSTGVLTFAKAKDMFADFNDYRVEQNELAFISEDPLSIRISKVSYTPDDMYKEYNEMAFIYAVYKTFAHTPVNQITVEAYPIYEDLKTNKQKVFKNLTIKATITREKALEVLKKHSSAKSFDDLVQLEENNQYREIGVNGSDLWDKFIYSDKERPNIIADLIKG